MQLRRLSWAGVEVLAEGSRLLIDPLSDAAPLADFLGSPRAPLVPVAVDARTWAAVTHLHRDHCDLDVLRRLPAGQAICHEAIAPELAAAGIGALSTGLWEPVDVGPFRLMAVPSHDWRGDEQVAWVVDCGGRRLIHCGDTIWHGGWYEIARRCAPFDLAFLPINGVIAQLAGFTPTAVPATLTPEQAVEAGVVLRARRSCAMHHGLFHNPPRYVEQDRAVQRLEAAAARRGIDVVAPRDGEPVRLAPRLPRG